MEAGPRAAEMARDGIHARLVGDQKCGAGAAARPFTRPGLPPIHLGRRTRPVPPMSAGVLGMDPHLGGPGMRSQSGCVSRRRPAAMLTHGCSLRWHAAKGWTAAFICCGDCRTIRSARAASSAAAWQEAP